MRPAGSKWFDPAALERMERIGGPELREEIVGIFVRMADERVAALHEACEGQDRHALRAGLHGLVSTAGNVGGLELYRIALHGQAEALEAPWEELAGLVARADAAMRRLVARLEEPVA